MTRVRKHRLRWPLQAIPAQRCPIARMRRAKRSWNNFLELIDRPRNHRAHAPGCPIWSAESASPSRSCQCSPP
eukprot:8066717-Alexandrium_andersonii.AAC.1